MRISVNKFLVRGLLAVAIAIPAMATVQVSSADAHHKNLRRGAVIAGAIIGGALVYHHYRKNRKYRHHRGYHRTYGGRYYYGRHPRYHRVYRHHPRYRRHYYGGGFQYRYHK